MLTDSHCHLDLLSLTPNYDLSAALETARNAGVKNILCPGVTLADTQRVLEISQKYQNIYAAIGSHPTEEIDQIITEKQIAEFAKDPLVIAIGETGLDYYDRDGGAFNDEQKQRQIQKFRAHIHVALDYKKPLIIHSRDASIETLEILKAEGAAKVGGVFHCFTYNWEIAKQVLELGFYLGISGIATFKNAHILQEVIRKTPLEKILLETDAPFLAPAPYRGKTNEPKYLVYIAQQVAQLKGITIEEVAEKTTANFLKFINNS